MKKILTISCWLVVQSMMAQQPQKTLTIEQARMLMQTHYPAIKGAELGVSAIEKIQKTAIDLGTTSIFTGKEEVGNGKQGIQTMWGIQQEGIDLLGIPAKSQLAKSEVALAKSKLHLTQKQLLKELSQAWVKAYSQQKIYEVYQKIDTSFSDIIRAAQIRYEYEATSKLDYLATQNQAYQVKIQKDQAYRDEQAALQQFNQYLASEEFYFPELLPTEVLTAALHPIEEMTIENPLLQLQKQEVEVAESSLKSIKSEYYPKFNVEYSQQKVDGQNGFYSYQVGIQLPLIFNAQKGKVQKVQLDYQIAETQYQQKELELKTVYQNLQQEYLKWKSSWEYYNEKALPLAEEQRQGSILAYKEGEIDYITFLQNIKDAIATEVQAWEAFRNYMNTYYELEFYSHQ